MSMLVTLFGGGVLIAVLYFALRLMGVSNYWRSIVSGAIPTIIYIAYAATHWNGLDVVSIHIAVFLSTATGLALLGSSKEGGKAKLHWVPKAIIVFFLGLFVVDGAFMYMSQNGMPLSISKWILPEAKNHVIYTAFPGVVPHAEEAAASVSAHLSEMERQRKLGWTVGVKGFESMKLGQSSQITVNLIGRDGMPMDDAEVTLSILRPAKSQEDQKVSLAKAGGGLYQGLLRLEEPGRWIVIVRAMRGKDQYETQAGISIAE